MVKNCKKADPCCLPKTIILNPDIIRQIPSNPDIPIFPPNCCAQVSRNTRDIKKINDCVDPICNPSPVAVGDLLVWNGTAWKPESQTPRPVNKWYSVITSMGNTGPDQSLTYAFQALPAANPVVNFTSDPTAVIDSTNFTPGPTDIEYTTLLSDDFLVRFQAYVTFTISPGSSPIVKFNLKNNGVSLGQDSVFWSGSSNGQFIELQLNETFSPSILSIGDKLTLDLSYNTAGLTTFNVNYKMWVVPATT